MDKKYLTIKEFADASGKTVQNIYKQLNRRFKPYVRINQGQKEISSEALEIYYGVKQLSKTESTEDETGSTKNETDSTKNETDLTDETTDDLENSIKTQEELNNPLNSSKNEIKEDKALNRLIDILQKQLEEKDKQIAVKDKQIQDLSDRLEEAMQLIKGQQFITAADKTTELLEANSKREQQKEPPIVINQETAKGEDKSAHETNKEESRAEETPEPHKKKSFWQRLFG